jgi:activator of HSP90 ATPase
MALPASTANWHWKNKGVTGWGKEWFENNLTTIIITEGDSTVGVESVTGFEGDVEMGMRKSK